MRLEGKSAIVTGGAQGIGQAVCLAFAREGADVMVADILGSSARKVSDKVKATGRKSLSCKVDVSNKQDVDAMVDQAGTAFGKIDLLVCAAGIFTRSPMEEISEADWDRVMAVNLKGAFLCCRAAGPKMIEQGGGCIVNVASIAGLTPQVGLGAYSPSKAGLIMLSKLLAVEWAKHGVRVNALCPGPTATPMFMSIYDSEEKVKRRKRAIPLNRFASPEEIANAAVYISSDEAGFITADSFVIDGGSSNSMFQLIGLLPETE